MKLLDDMIDLLKRHRNTGYTTKLISAMSGKDTLVVATQMHQYNLKQQYPTLKMLTLCNTEKTLGKDGTIFLDNYALLSLLHEIKKYLNCQEYQITELQDKLNKIREIL